MFKQPSNEAFIARISRYCLFIVKTVDEAERWESAVILDKSHAVSALHCVPDECQQLNCHVVLYDCDGNQHETVIHGMNSKLDYAVFKKTVGEFVPPEIIYPAALDKYIAVVSQYAYLTTLQPKSVEYNVICLLSGLCIWGEEIVVPTWTFLFCQQS